MNLGNAICAELKLTCVWVSNDFDGLIPALKAGKFDAIQSSMTVTEARKKQIDFSDRLYCGPTARHLDCRRTNGQGARVDCRHLGAGGEPGSAGTAVVGGLALNPVGEDFTDAAPFGM